jgi:translation initiation factor IF-2
LADLKELLRPELAVKYYPVILKSSSAGTLETLISEVEKVAPHLHLIDYGVGPITEADLRNASAMGAVIFGFNVELHPPVEMKA